MNTENRTKNSIIMKILDKEGIKNMPKFMQKDYNKLIIEKKILRGKITKLLNNTIILNDSDIKEIYVINTY